MILAARSASSQLIACWRRLVIHHAGDQLITRALAAGYPPPGQRRPLVGCWRRCAAPRHLVNSSSTIQGGEKRRAAGMDVIAPPPLGTLQVVARPQANRAEPAQEVRALGPSGGKRIQGLRRL